MIQLSADQIKELETYLMEIPAKFANPILGFLGKIAGTTAFISVANVQPIVSLIASLIAIVSGLLAARYYIKATKRFK